MMEVHFQFCPQFLYFSLFSFFLVVHLTISCLFRLHFLRSCWLLFLHQHRQACSWLFLSALCLHECLPCPQCPLTGTHTSILHIKHCRCERSPKKTKMTVMMMVIIKYPSSSHDNEWNWGERRVWEAHVSLQKTNYEANPKKGHNVQNKSTVRRESRSSRWTLDMK